MDLFNTQVKIGIDTKAFVNGVKEAERVNKELTKEIEKTKDETKDLGKEVDNEGKQAQESAGENKNLGDKIKTAGDHAEKSSGKFKELASSIKDGLATAAKVGIGAITAAGTAVGAVVKQSVSEYGTYEQLVGGVEKLFGESADLMMMYAQDAYKTAGMSVNEYMETATSFAAALTSSVQAAGGSMDEAVEYADTAMRDMSDNANTFGTEMASIQNAYQGFAKQNYTMLDNLKLGYGGTKAEMERLIDDANKLRREQGINNDLTVESYADIITAIHEVQTAMNITGTTSREASKTISGSINAAKAAWKNLTVEIAKDDGDINSAFDALGGTVGDVIDNIIPRVEKAVGGIGGLISTAAPQVIKGINSLLPKVLPSLIKSAGSVLSAVGQGLFEATPAMLELGKNALQNLAEGMQNAEFDSSGILGKILDSITDNSADYFSYGEKIIAGISNSIINLNYSKLGSSFSTIVKNALGSMTDLLADLDSRKIGNDIADFVKSVDWKGIARNIVDLIGAAIGSLGDIATGFFENMDGETFMTALSFLAAPKLLGGMLSAFKGPKCATEFTNIKDYLSQEIGGSGDDAGMTWSSAFLAGIKAFGLGWAIGTYLRDNITIGDKTIGEWVDYAFDQMESKGEKEEAQDKLIDEYGSFYYKNSAGNIVKGNKYDASTTTHLSDAFIKAAESGNVQYSNMAEVVQGMRGIIEKDNETTDFYFDPILAKRADHNAIGNYIDRPTLTWAAENEPEYMIPESKMDEVYPRNNGNTYFGDVHIHIEGYNIQNDDRMAELISEKLAELSIRQQRALGGAAW